MKKENINITLPKVLFILAVLMIIIMIFFTVKNNIEKNDIDNYNIEMHTVYVGDTLWEIAETYKPDDMDVRGYIYLIKEVNEGNDLSFLYPGEVIYVPIYKG